jgi:uncharacterized protein YoaH (UPF0181 family)
MEFSKQVTMDNSSVKSNTANTVENTLTPEEQQKAQEELSQLSNIIKEWKQTAEEVKILNEAMREKRKKVKVQEEMILRIMKKHNIGALDLKGSGGRILYRRSTTKGGMNDKLLFGLLAQHLKSETAAADAINFITEQRVAGAKTKESLLYEKE